MKKRLVIVIQLCCAVTVFAQGQINFNNRSPAPSTAAAVAPVYGLDPAHPTDQKFGNAATGPLTPVPVGTQVYGGAPLVGTGFTASIWGRVAGTQDSFIQAATTPFRTTTSSSLFGFWQPPGTAAILPNVPSDPLIRAEVLIRVWDNRGGTIASWDQVQANDLIPRGESLPFVVPDQLGGGIVIPPNLVGLQSFQLYIVPEPSVIALAVFGAGCLLVIRRRK